MYEYWLYKMVSFLDLRRNRTTHCLDVNGDVNTDKTMMWQSESGCEHSENLDVAKLSWL